MRSLVCGLVLLAVSICSAGATDLDFDDSDDAGQSTYDWGGIYIGGSVGYGWLEDADHQFTPPLEDTGEDWVAGVHVGVLHQIDNIVLGIEFEAMRLDIDYEVLSFITIDDAYVIKGRVGYAFDRWLISGQLGGSYLTTNFMGLNDWGLALGAGVDYALTDHLIVGAQYTHYVFEDFDGHPDRGQHRSSDGARQLEVLKRPASAMRGPAHPPNRARPMSHISKA